MVTFASARAELVTAMAAVGHGATSQPGAIDSPYVLISGDGADVTHILRGAVPSTWRLVLVAGKWDAKGAADELDILKQSATSALRDLADWRVDSLGRDGVREYAGGQYLTAELRGIRMIDI